MNKLNGKIDKFLDGNLILSFEKEYLPHVQEYLGLLLGKHDYYIKHEGRFAHISKKTIPLWFIRKCDIKDIKRESRELYKKQIEGEIQKLQDRLNNIDK